MKKYLFSLFTLLAFVGLQAQQMTFKKGMILDSLQVGDSIPETYSLYLPTQFDTAVRWPLVLVYDMQGHGSQALGMLRAAAEESGYILVASNAINDSLSIADNILVTNRLLKWIASVFPINQQRMYTAGLGRAGQMAALVPSFIKEMAGVLALGSAVPNTEILNDRNRFYFLGLVGKGDFNYPDMMHSKEYLDRKDFPNQLIVFEGGEGWPEQEYLKMAFELLSLQAMKAGRISVDSQQVSNAYDRMLGKVNRLVFERRPFMAYSMLEELMEVYDGLLEVDSLESSLRTLKRDARFREQRRNENNVLFREELLREDYRFFLEEDLLTYNFNNLGWWTFQMEELEKFRRSDQMAEQYMGSRLHGYLNALVEDQIDLLEQPQKTDEEALLFLYMLKTITAPEEYPYYLKIISLSSRYEDYGTALFYLEELLKQGYKDKETLYGLEHTALLRITPEYNTLVAKYLEDARYEIDPQ